MTDGQDWMLAQGTVDFRREEREHAIGHRFECVVDESAGMADECSCYEAGRDPICRVHGHYAGDPQALSFCTSSDDCTADVDGHRPDCPVEAKLRDEFAF